jgi:hypothetical protein
LATNIESDLRSLSIVSIALGEMSSECMHMGGAANGTLDKSKKRKAPDFGPGTGTYGKQRVHTRVVVNSMKENPLE